MLVHRDITLKNILYLDHHIYLIDFDISRFYSSTKNKDTHIFGTRGYLAPEQYGYAQSKMCIRDSFISQGICITNNYEIFFILC